jgi:hypothetical protein
MPALCNKAIATIINKANRKLVESLRKKRTGYIKRALSATTTTSKPLRAYNITPKTNSNSTQYETQPPTTSQHTHLELSIEYKNTLRKNTPATPQITSHLLHGKTH